MERPRHWLDVVEAVLKAKTGDLRALAKLAGENPSTLYIGTRIDGADLRGQDLRGMAFGHLDPTKVETDSATQFDALPADLSEAVTPDISPTARAAIFIASVQTPKEISQLRRWLPSNVEVFPPEEFDKFQKVARRIEGPKFAIIDYLGRDPPNPRHISLGRDIITVAIWRGRASHFDYSKFFYDHAFDGPVIVVPSITMAMFSRQPLLSGAARDLIITCLADWNLVEATLRQQPISAYVRGTGTKPHPATDAWYKLFNLANKVSLYGKRAHLFSSRRASRPEFSGLPSSLFPNVDLIKFTDYTKKTDSYIVSGLYDLSEIRDTPDSAYLRAAQVTVRDLGWLVKNIDDRLDHNFDFDIEGPDWVGKVSIAGDAPVHRLPEAEDLPLSHISFSDIRHIMVSEEFTDRHLVNSLSRREIWANIGDLRYFKVNSPSIWPIVMQQTKRISRSFDARSRTRYFSAVLREMSGLNDLSVIYPELSEFENDSSAPDRYSISASKFEWKDGAMTCTISLSHNEYVVEHAKIASLKLTITSHGAFLSEYPKFLDEL